MSLAQAATGNASLVEGEGSAWWLDAHTRRLVEETLSLTGELTFTVRPGTLVRLTREQVAHLPMEEFTALWKVSAYGCASINIPCYASYCHACCSPACAGVICAAAFIGAVRLHLAQQHMRQLRHPSNWCDTPDVQEYINAYADCLVKANGEAESPAGKRLVRWFCALGFSTCCDRVPSWPCDAGAAPAA